MSKRIEATFYGRVQGVGFRFTAIRFAEAFSLKGYVKNLPDGSVEVVAEGKEDDLKGFLEKINDYFEDYIQDTDLNWLEATGEFKGFRIEF